MRKVNKMKYLSVFSVVTLIFIVGIILGQAINEFGVRDFTRAQADLKVYLLSLDVQTELASKYICEVDVFALTKDKAELGRQIESLEDKLGKDNKEILGLKREYSLLSIRQWLLLERMNEECGKGLTPILFFYSNVENASLSESQGYVLDYLYDKYPNRIAIFSFDMDLEDSALNALKSANNVTIAPSLVINDELYPGLQRRNEIESIILG